MARGGLWPTSPAQASGGPDFAVGDGSFCRTAALLLAPLERPTAVLVVADSNRTLAAAFEAHHFLDDGLTLLENLVLFSRFVGAVFTQLLAASRNTDDDELVNLFTADLAYRHASSLQKVTMSHHPTNFQGSVTEAITASIKEKIPDASVDVTGQGGHYSIVVTSEAFRGKGLVASQRLVYGAITHLMSGDLAPVHAVDSLKTRTPD
jgi:acid stress-induced BolA-like protein IbaG/YrbA